MKDRGYDTADEFAANGHVSGPAEAPSRPSKCPIRQITDPASQPAPAPEVDQIVARMTGLHGANGIMTNLSPAVRLKQGRTKLLLDFPFFGVLILRLKDIETPSIDTMATDGVSLFYNPEFVAKLTPPELLGCLAHEVMHPALQHHTRRGTRSLKRWNVACDFAINPLIRDANLELPAGALYDPEVPEPQR